MLINRLVQNLSPVGYMRARQIRKIVTAKIRLSVPIKICLYEKKKRKKRQMYIYYIVPIVYLCFLFLYVIKYYYY